MSLSDNEDNMKAAVLPYLEENSLSPPKTNGTAKIIPFNGQQYLFFMSCIFEQSLCVLLWYFSILSDANWGICSPRN